MLKELLYFSDLPPLFILVIMEDTLRAREFLVNLIEDKS